MKKLKETDNLSDIPDTEFKKINKWIVDNCQAYNVEKDKFSSLKLDKHADVIPKSKARIFQDDDHVYVCAGVDAYEGESFPRIASLQMDLARNPKILKSKGFLSSL